MSSPAERLAAAVKARRENELRLNQLEVAGRGGPSNSKLTEIENGRLAQLTPSTERKLDKGLGWLDGSARRVWNGTGDAIPIPPAATDALAAMEASNMRPADKELLRQLLAAATTAAQDDQGERGAS